MARQPRITSESGIYHVMLRGVNRMRIFHDKSDYRHFLEALELQTEKRVSALPSDRQAEELAHCEVYSFCLMTNHLHLLVRTMDEPIGKVMQRITSAYVYYFNHKYKRVGHLFQERFKSEPVEDEDYFITLLRYIHQNPVKAGMVEHVGEYTWSSWRELTSDGHPGFCNKQRVLELITLQELTDLVNNPMEHAEEEGIIDYDSDEEANGKSLLSPDDMLSLMIDYTGSHSAMEFRNLPKPVQRDCIGRIISEGGTIRELANLTGIPRSTVQRFASAWSDSKQPACMVVADDEDYEDYPDY